MKAHELRIGNLYYYQMEDPLDERQRWLEPAIIDLEDLQHLSECPDDPDYLPMPINSETLSLLGAAHLCSNTYQVGRYFVALPHSGPVLILGHIHSIRIPIGPAIHQLQNIYHALTGEELPTCNIPLTT